MQIDGRLVLYTYAINVTTLRSYFAEITKRSKQIRVSPDFKVASKNDTQAIGALVPFQFHEKLDLRKDGKYFLTIKVPPTSHDMLQKAWTSHPKIDTELPLWVGDFIRLLKRQKDMWDNSLHHYKTSHDGEHIVLWRTDELDRFINGKNEE